MRKVVSQFVAVTLLVLTGALSSCNKSPMNDMLKAVPASADVVVVGDVKTVLESCGGSIEDDKIKLPLAISDLIPEGDKDDLTEINQFISNGVDPQVAALIGDYDLKDPIFVLKLSDAKKFRQYIEDNGFREKNSDSKVVSYSKLTHEDNYDPNWNHYILMVTTNDFVYGASVRGARMSKMQDRAEDMAKEAMRKSMADTKMGEYISGGNAMGMSVRMPKEFRNMMREAGLSSELIEQLDGYYCASGNLEGDKAVLRMKCFTENGKEMNADVMKSMCNTDAKVSDKALGYLGKDQQMVMAMSMKDFNWDKYFELLSKSQMMDSQMQAVLSIMKSYLSKIDGTIAIGFGINNGLDSILDMAADKDIMSQWSGTLVIEMAQGKGKSVLIDLKSLMELGEIPYEETSKGIVIENPSAGIRIVAEVRDDILVVTNGTVKDSNDNPVANELDIDDYIGGFGAVVNKGDKLMKDLGLKNDVAFSVYFDAKNMESVCELKVTGRKDNVLANLLDLVMDIVAQSGRLEQDYESRREAVWQERYSSWEDELFADTVAYEEAEVAEVVEAAD